MTPKEAIEHLKLIPDNEAYSDYFQDVCRTAIEALSVVEQIRWERDITLEQLEEIGVGLGAKMDKVKDACEKQIPKKPLGVIDHYFSETYDYDFSTAKCACCKNEFSFDEYHKPLHCEKCGQAIDWSDEE